MSLLTRLGEYVPFLSRGKPSLPRDQMLALRPARNPVVEWERKAPAVDEEAGEAAEPGPVVLRVPRRDDTVGQILSRLFQIPAFKTVELDEFGSQVWERCDGGHTVEQLVRHTCDAYKLNRRQAEVSVTTFMRMLAQRRLVGFIPGGKTSHVNDTSANAQSIRRAKRARQPARPRRR